MVSAVSLLRVEIYDFLLMILRRCIRTHTGKTRLKLLLLPLSVSSLAKQKSRLGPCAEWFLVPCPS